MEDSTLPPTPTYNPNIPIVTANGGTNVAYKDPNSPESILKKTTELNAQVNIDTKYDVAVSPYYKEGFQCSTTILQHILLITIVLFVTVISADKLSHSGRIFLLLFCGGLLVLSLVIYHQSV